MYEILKNLPAGSYVLDVGSSRGSFDPACTEAAVIRLDRETFARTDAAHCVQGDAAQLPFRDGQFSTVIANHSFEHFDRLNEALQEIKRILTPSGALFISVPDSSTVTDRLYRWLASGGGHVHQFTSAKALAALIETTTGLKHVGTRDLYTSLSFLNRRNAPRPRPKRLLLIGGGTEWSLFLFAWLSRTVDRCFRSRTSLYGWAMYFGEVSQAIDLLPCVNVCIRCGSGHPSSCLIGRSVLRTIWPGIRLYRCPHCRALNPFLKDDGS